MTTGPLVIAIDGPAAAGKGTLARHIAEALDFAHLDTGLLYRAIGLIVLRAKQDPMDEAAALAAAEGLESFQLDDPALRQDDVASAAAKVAACQWSVNASSDSSAISPPRRRMGRGARWSREGISGPSFCPTRI